MGKSVALVTGSSSGIGRAIAVRLAGDGFHVLAHYHRNEKGAHETAAAILSRGGSTEVLSFDVRDPDSVEEALERTLKKMIPPRIDAVVNNAGTHRDSLAGMMSNAAFDDVLQTNLYGPFYILRWSARKMIRQRSGCLVNIASLSGQTGNAGQINYAASKAGLIAMTKTLSAELGPRGIRVNAIAPGIIETDWTGSIPYLEEIKQRIPLRRCGLVSEVAGAASFLCSPDASYITGHTLSVNGGLFPS